MIYTDFLKAVKAGQWSRGYLFYGAEEYLKRYAVAEVKKALFPDPAMADWNRRSLDDENYTPADLREAIHAFEADELLTSTLGEHIVTQYVEGKRREWEEYRTVVTDWELNKYIVMY